MKFSRRTEFVLVEFQKRECGQGQNRTADTRIFSPLLYRLSYLATALKYRVNGRASQDWQLQLPILFGSLLDEVNHLALEPDAVQRVNFLDTRRARDVDFGEIAADHVKADKV